MTERGTGGAISKRLALGIVVVGVIGLWYAKERLDRFMYPWADTKSGRPVLLGSWVGQLTTGGGRPRVVMLEIVRERAHLKAHTAAATATTASKVTRAPATSADGPGATR